MEKRFATLGALFHDFDFLYAARFGLGRFFRQLGRHIAMRDTPAIVSRLNPILISDSRGIVAAPAHINRARDFPFLAVLAQVH